MAEFATKTVFPFEPLKSGIVLDSTGTKYTTPTNFMEKLADLARLSYIKGQARYVLRLSGASATGEATISLSDGNSTLWSDTVDLSSATVFTGRADVDLSGVNGGADLRWQVSVGTAGDASLTGEFAGHVIAESPLVIGGC